MIFDEGQQSNLLILKDQLNSETDVETTRMPVFWDTSRHPMITHTSDAHQIASQNKTKSKLQI